MRLSRRVNETNGETVKEKSTEEKGTVLRVRHVLT